MRPVPSPLPSCGWSATAPLYGQIRGGQTSSVAGNYLSVFAGTQTAMAVNVSKNGGLSDCNGIAGASTGRSFTALAVVAKQCMIQTSPLDFGTLEGHLASGIDTATVITTQCTAGVAYQIGLDNGLHSSAATRRMSGGGSEFVAYELYLDSGRTQRWGNTLNNDTLSLTGTGQPQGSPVNGRVPAQAAAAPGLYSDTVTVTVTY
jgi:spore coat protein U-like protein